MVSNFIEPLFLRIGHKNDSVGAFQDQLAAGFRRKPAQERCTNESVF